MTPPPRTTTTALLLLLVTTFFFVAITGATVTTTPPLPPHQKPLQLKLHHKHNHSDENYIHSKIKGDRTRRQKWLSAAKKALSTHFTFGQELDLVIVGGNLFRDGEVVIFADIGTHKSSQIFSLDTGSDESWLQCNPCRDCYEQKVGIYDPILSADSETVLYTDPVCGNVLDLSQGENNECRYNISYLDGSFTAGRLTRDKISWTRVDGQELFSAKIPIGCGDQNVGFQNISGVLALSRGPLSLVTTFNLQTLAYCLGFTGTSSYIIFNNTSPPEENTVHLNLVRGVDPTDNFLYVELTGIMVGSQVVPIPEGTFDLRPDGTGGGVVLDTDTMLTYLTEQAYDPLEKAFIAQTQTLISANSPDPDFYRICFVKRKGVQNIYPEIVFSFQQGQVQLSWRGYMVNAGRGIECFGILPENDKDGSSILGSFFQRGIQFNYDFAQNDISMTFNKCIN